MRRPGLFRALLWRELIIIVCSLVALYLLSTWFVSSLVNRASQHDLKQEANWTAKMLPAVFDPLALAQAWRDSHPDVRLVLSDAAGQVLVDTQADTPPLRRQDSEAPLLVGRSVTTDGADQVTLTRYGMLRHPWPWHDEFILILLAFLAFASAVLYPLVRELTVNFDLLSSVARQVAGGKFGQTLDPPRQRELADLVASFNNMSLRLRDAEARQNRLIADVSHELRSPLGRLRALAETITRRPGEGLPYLSQMDAEISLLDRLVGDLLDMARFDAGEACLKIVRVSLLQWAQDAFVRSQHRIEQHKIVVLTHLPDNDLEVMIDSERLLQVFSNLVENAIVATGECNAPRIELSLVVSAQSWCLSVTDNGRGIPAEDLPFVFDRFFRVEKHRGRQTGGAGLGLSIARAAVTAQGGEISIESIVDLGTTVYLKFPVRS